jgi:HSP20 family protein
MDDRRNPFEEIERLFDRMGSQFQGDLGGGLGEMSSMGGTGVAMDLADHGDEFVVTADLPGYRKENIDVQLRGDQLHVSAERETESQQDEGGDGGRFIRRERERQSANRTLTLPEEVDEDGVSASYRNGVLTVHLSKADASSGGHSIDIE